MAILAFMEDAWSSHNAANPLNISIAFLGVICLVIWRQLQVIHDSREPPLVKPRIPIFGHLFGMILQRNEFYRRVGLDNPHLPIFSLPIGPTKVYVIASPQLIQQAMRKKTLSFDPLTIAFADRMVGFGPNLMHLMHHPPTDGSISWLNDQHRGYESLAPGLPLHAMNTHVLNSISEILSSVGPQFETKPLYLWIRDTFTLATTGALFGAKNPIADDPSLVEALWDFETAQVSLLFQPFPKWTAPKAYYGRLKIQLALREYFRAGYDQNSDVSVVIKDRAAINRKWGLPVSDIADHELGMLFVSVTNAIPTLFWMITFVFRDPSLVRELREELLGILKVTTDISGQRHGTFNVAKFSTGSPLLVATYNEVMRIKSRQAGTRTILEDTYLEDSQSGKTYLLKKGVNIQMPAMVSNWATATWGSDVEEFNPKRFITDREQERLQNKAFNPFGGGKHLCPGRHFAFAEILGTVAALVLGFEITTPDGGLVSVPPNNNNVAEAICKPLQTHQQTFMANIRRRPGWEEVRWDFTTGGGNSQP